MKDKEYTTKETIENVLNANENARERDKAEKRNIILIGALPVVSVVSAGITTVLMTLKIQKDKKKSKDLFVAEAKSKLDKVSKKADEAVKKAEDIKGKINDYSGSFTGVNEGGDKHD